MRAQDVMTTPVITIDADARVIDAAEQLSANRITSMPVLDADGHLVGMISWTSSGVVLPMIRAAICDVTNTICPIPTRRCGL